MGSGVIAPKAGRRTRPSRCQEIGHDPHELVEPIMMHPVPRTGDVGDPRIAEMRRPAVLLRVARPALHAADEQGRTRDPRSEEHTSELQSLMRISYAVFCLKKKTFSWTSEKISLVGYWSYDNI